MGFIRDLVSGKEKTARADALTGDINKAGKSGLKYLTAGAAALNSVYSQDPSAMVQNQIARENQVARTAAEDAGRRTSQLISQRGIQNSSIGIGQEVNNRRNLMQTIGMNTASGVQRLREALIENAQGRIAAGNAAIAPKFQAAGSGLQMQNVKYRTGGYGDLIKAGAQMYASGGA